MYMSSVFLVLMLVCSLSVFGARAVADAVDDVNAGVAALNRGNDDEAIRLLTQALNSGQLSIHDQTITFYDRGSVWNDKGEFDKAITDFSEALRLNPKYEGAFANRGMAWDDKGEFDKAIADENEAIRLNPQDAVAFLNRGYAWTKKGESDKAIDDFNEALRLNPKYEGAFANRGVAWEDKGEFDRAIADENEAIRLNPQDAGAFSNRGDAWRDKGEYDKAIADYSEAIRLNPKYGDAFYNRGLAWSDKKENDKAIADYSEAIRLNPQNVRAIYNRGVAQFCQMQFEAAATDFVQAQKLVPHASAASSIFTIWLYLSRARYGTGNARSEFAANTKNINVDTWLAQVITMFKGKVDPKVIAARAANADPTIRKNRMCEADFYIGEWSLLKRKWRQARTHFLEAQKECPKDFGGLYDTSISELKRYR